MYEFDVGGMSEKCWEEVQSCRVRTTQKTLCEVEEEYLNIWREEQQKQSREGMERGELFD